MSELQGRPSRKVKDPVCGMWIDPATAAAAQDWQGTTWHFCSTPCAAKFNGAADRGGSATPPATSSPVAR